MIGALSKNVVIMLVLLALANAGAGYGLYEYLMPLRAQKDQELSSLKAEVEARRQEVAKLKEEFVLLQLQLRDFKELEALGFFNNQNRVKAQEGFDSIRDLSGLLRTRYDISSGQLIEEPRAVEANHVVLKSPVKLEVESLDDVDVYTFIKGLNEKFPGSVDLTRITLQREEDLTAPILRQIGSGSAVKLVSAEVEFDWRTMANRDRLIETDRSSSSGGQNAADYNPVPAPIDSAPQAQSPQVQPPVAQP